MKRLALSLFILFLPFIVLNWLFAVAEFDFGKTNRISQFRAMPEGIVLANTGSSHGQFSFNYTDFAPLRTFNFGLPAQSLLYDRNLLRQFAPRFAPGSVVLVPVSYFEVSAIVEEHLLESYRARYFRLLDRANIDRCDNLATYVKYRYLPSLMAKHPFRTIVQNLRPENVLPEEGGGVPQFSDKTAAEQYENLAFTKKTFDNNFRESGAEGAAYNKALLRNITALCLSHGITPVLVTTPLTTMYNDLYEAAGFFPAFEQFKADVLAANPGTAWLDYSHDAAFTEDYALFFDGDHMNDEGAAAMTRRILSDLRERRILD